MGGRSPRRVKQRRNRDASAPTVSAAENEKGDDVASDERMVVGVTESWVR